LHDHGGWMRYVEAIERLRGQRRVLVTGPARSGTTIASRMIAADLGLPWLKEDRVRNDDVALFRRLVGSGSDFCLQGPGLSHVLHRECGDVAVVFMRRDLMSIIRSQIRLEGQMPGWVELNERRYGGFYRNEFGSAMPGWRWEYPVPVIKYEIWEMQRSSVPFSLELDYESMSSHELWVSKDERAGFTPHQTQKEEKI